MPYAEKLANAMVTAAKEKAVWVGLMEGSAPIETVKSTGSLIEAANTFAANDIVVFTSVTGPTNILANVPYYVLGTELSGAHFQLAGEEGGAAITPNVAIAAAKLRKIKEISGGSPAYARVKTAVGAVSKREAKDETAREINIPASTVSFEAYFELETGKNLVGLSTLEKDEVVGSQSKWTVTSTTLSLA